MALASAIYTWPHRMSCMNLKDPPSGRFLFSWDSGRRFHTFGDLMMQRSWCCKCTMLQCPRDKPSTSTPSPRVAFSLARAAQVPYLDPVDQNLHHRKNVFFPGHRSPSPLSATFIPLSRISGAPSKASSTILSPSLLEIRQTCPCL